MLTDDRLDYPMVVRAKIDFRGKLNRKALNKAFEVAFTAHPLFRCKVKKFRRDFFWYESDFQPFEVNDHHSKAFDDSIHESVSAIDLTNERGIRASIATKNDLSRLIVDFHHVCSDGLGVLYFFHDLFEAYDSIVNNHSGQNSIQPRRLDALRAQSIRIGPGRALWKFIKRIPQELCGCIGLAEYFSHKPIELNGNPPRNDPQANEKRNVPTNKPLEQDQPSSGFITVRIPQNELKQIRSVLKSRRKTVNDYFVAAVMNGIDRNQAQTNGHIRAMVPVNLRDHASFSIAARQNGEIPTASNVVSMIFLDRRPWKHKKFQSLLNSVALEMKAIKFLKLETTFINLLRFLKLSRIGIHRLVPRKCVTTTVASNLGRLFYGSPFYDHEFGDKKLHFGGLTLEDLVITPPFRYATPATIAAFTYADEFVLSMIYSTRDFSREAATDLIESIQHELLHRAYEL